MTEWELKELEWDFSWLDEMDKSCPFCKSELEIAPGTTDQGVAAAKCACGFTATFTAPYDLDPDKDVPIEFVL